MIRSLLARRSAGQPGGNEHAARVPRGLSVIVASLLVFGAVLANSARAESPGPDEAVAPPDPPARVGRLAHVEGVVSFRAAGQDQWVAATLNYPVTSGDAVWTEPEAHAVVEVGPAAIRLGGGAELDVIQIDLHVAQLQLAQGSANIRLAEMPQGDSYVVATPRGAVTLLEPGLYRIDAGSADQPTRVAAFHGTAAFAGGGSSLTVEPGQAVEISGQDTVGYAVHPAGEDELDRWAAGWDQRPVVTQAPPVPQAVEPVPGQAGQYVSPEATGYQDLDRYGTWATAPEYGPVWYPTAVPEGWVPYRYGHWAWVAPWGWTWIDDAPWGFTPFHYGRWVFVGDRWAWVPGELVAEPVYAPALVSFIGGPDWSVEVAEGPVPAFGWIPLAPEEIFVPFFHCSPTFVREVNITNVNEVVINEFITKNVIVNKTVVNETVVNNTVAGKPFGPSGAPTVVNRQTAWANQHAATVVAHKDFVSGRPAATAALRVTPAALKTAPVAAARGPDSLPRPIAANAAPAQLAPKPPVTAQLHTGAPALHGSAPVQAGQRETGHALAATPPEKARAQSGLPNVVAPAPRVVRGEGMASAPGPHPVPAAVPAHQISPGRAAQGAPAVAQPHPVQPVMQPHQVQSVPQPHPMQPVAQVHQGQPVPQPHPVQPAMQPHQGQSVPQPHPVQPVMQPHQVQSVPQPHPVQPVMQPHQGQSVPQPHPVQPVMQPHQVQSVPQPHPVQSAVQPRQAQSAPQPHPMQQFAQPRAAPSIAPMHNQAPAAAPAPNFPHASAPPPHQVPQIVSLPAGPRAAPPAVAPNRPVAMPQAHVERAVPQAAHVMPRAPAPQQPRIAAPAVRTAPPQPQGNPAPAHGRPPQQQHGDPNG